MPHDVKVRTDKASQAFGKLKRSAFQDGSLSITTKCAVYKAVASTRNSALLFGDMDDKINMPSLKS